MISQPDKAEQLRHLHQLKQILDVYRRLRFSLSGMSGR